MIGSNQVSARNQNIESILRLLIEERLSSSDLAKRLGLTKPALTKIIEEMSELGLIEVTNHEKETNNGVGRKKIFYKISEKAGIVGVIDFGPTDVSISMANFDGHILETYKIEDCEFLTHEIMAAIRGKLIGLKNKYERDLKKLLVVCISTPGKIDKETEEIIASPKFKECLDIKLKDYFKKAVEAKIIVKNDINLTMIGERKMGVIDSGVEDGVLLFIDSGIGGAILNRGKVLEGERGFAGEFGLIKIRDRFGKVVYIDSVCSTNSIKNHLRYLMMMGDELGLPEDFRWADVVKAYIRGEEEVRETIDFTAHEVGIVINTMHSILDCHSFYIAGRIRMLGEGYIEEVRKTVNNEEVAIKYTKLTDNAALVGALEVGILEGFKILVQNRK